MLIHAKHLRLESSETTGCFQVAGKTQRLGGKKTAIFRSLVLQFCIGPAVKGSNT